MIPSHREPTHPGEMLLEEFLNPLRLTQVAAAEQMQIPLNRLNEIIRGRRGVTADTAIRLSRLLGTSPEFWMNLQSTWDISKAAKSMHVDLGAVEASMTEEAVARVSGVDNRTTELRTEAWTTATVIQQAVLRPPAAVEENVAVRDTQLELVA
ncbi:MAG: addiction module antidote protein, HigA family [Acidobacteria bacterium]|nr:MAG: addiction module antidote protein, HigA family [Acidobacteriota bacterium]